MAAICEYTHAGGKRICRKHAQWVVCQKAPFGMRIGPHGDEPVYRQEVHRLCAYHAGKETVQWWLPGVKVGELPIAEYNQRLATSQGR